MTGHLLPSMLTRRRFTVTEYPKMVDAGILHEGDRVELLAGEIHNMSPIDPIHAAHVKRLNQLLGQLLDERFLIEVQDQIPLDDLSEPEPDITILQWRDDFYVHAHPVPEEILLLIEVANTSVHYTLPLYTIPLYTIPLYTIPLYTMTERSMCPAMQGPASTRFGWSKASGCGAIYATR